MNQQLLTNLATPYSERRAGSSRSVSVLPKIFSVAPLLLAAVLFLGATGSASAQDTSIDWTSQRLDQMLAALNSPVFSTREQATQELMDHSIEVAAVLTDSPMVSTMTPEQQVRILNVLEVAFRKSPRAGLGVSFARQNIGQGAMLASVLPAFPAAKTLQAEDIVTEVDGDQLSSIPNGAAAQYLRRAIISRDPGDYLPMRIMRNGEEFEVQVELGRYEDLGDAVPLQHLELVSAWDYRMHQRQLRPSSRASSIDVVALGARWVPPRLRMMRRPEAANLYTGGQSPAENVRLLAQTLRSIAPNGWQQQPNVQLQRPLGPATRANNRARISQAMQKLQLELVMLQQELGDTNLTQAQRQITSTQIISLQTQLRALGQQLDEFPR
jgi:PDZ domain-containing protein